MALSPPKRWKFATLTLSRAPAPLAITRSCCKHSRSCEQCLKSAMRILGPLAAKPRRCNLASVSFGAKEVKVQIKNRQQLLIFVTAGAVALFAADALVRAPLMNLWNARAARVTALRNQVARGRMLV